VAAEKPNSFRTIFDGQRGTDIDKISKRLILDWYETAGERGTITRLCNSNENGLANIKGSKIKNK
jgi:hypothetical protein